MPLCRRGDSRPLRHRRWGCRMLLPAIAGLQRRCTLLNMRQLMQQWSLVPSAIINDLLSSISPCSLSGGLHPAPTHHSTSLATLYRCVCPKWPKGLWFFNSSTSQRLLLITCKLYYFMILSLLFTCKLFAGDKPSIKRIWIFWKITFSFKKWCWRWWQWWWLEEYKEKTGVKHTGRTNMAWLGVDYITQRSMQYTSKD